MPCCVMRGVWEFRFFFLPDCLAVLTCVCVPVLLWAGRTQVDTLRKYSKVFELSVPADASAKDLGVSVGRWVARQPACAFFFPFRPDPCGLVCYAVGAVVGVARRRVHAGSEVNYYCSVACRVRHGVWCRHFEASLECDDDDCLLSFVKFVRSVRAVIGRARVCAAHVLVVCCASRLCIAHRWRAAVARVQAARC